ncbi:MAG: hypothetical protein EOO90_00155 [Pedobacter sp.]|nr:MAG: hypothetical protein EOO90_00155 [Pedobacter sp.]
MRHFNLLLWANLVVFICSAQNNQGGRLTAMGATGAAVKDLWGVAANPANIVGHPTPSLQITYQLNAISKDLSTQALAFVFPINKQAIGIHTQRYGMAEYQSNSIALILAKEFGPKLSLGIRGTYHQLRISGYGSTTAASIDVGIAYQLSDRVMLGYFLNNPSRSDYIANSAISIPTVGHLGISLQASDKLLLSGRINKENFALGFDYQLVSIFSIRSGISLSPLTHYFGIGLVHNKFIVDLTYLKNSQFTHTPQLSFGYAF